MLHSILFRVLSQFFPWLKTSLHLIIIRSNQCSEGTGGPDPKRAVRRSSGHELGSDLKAVDDIAQLASEPPHGEHPRDDGPTKDVNEVDSWPHGARLEDGGGVRVEAEDGGKNGKEGHFAPDSNEDLRAAVSGYILGHIAQLAATRR